MDQTLCPDPFHDGEDYLNEVFFGAQCYDLIDRSMQAILEYDDEYSAHDWRSLVQMCDHKYLMRKRYQYMVQHGYAAMDDTLHEELETLEKESLIAQNMYIKYTVTDDLETIRRLRERLQAMKQKDICATKTLISLVEA